MKVLIFDSSTIITLVMNGLEEILTSLKQKFDGKFIITPSVKYETIEHPITIKQFELGALRVQKLLEEKVFSLPGSLGISDSEIQEKSKEIIRQTNKIFLARENFIHIIDEGEASCLALSQILTEKGTENMIAVDERTTRMLGEKPENLQKLFEKKFHTSVKMEKSSLPDFSKMKFIRSSELAYLAWKKGFIDLKDTHTLDALLYGTKFKGASISREEIDEIKKL